MGVFNRLASCFLGCVPRPIVRRVASRYVAGTDREQLLARVSNLRARGLLTTVDLLGENVGNVEEAGEVAKEYHRLLEELGPDPHISVKLTHVGLRISEELAYEHCERLLAKTDLVQGFLRLDMEDSSTTDAAIRVYRALRRRSVRVGLAIQAYLRRSRDDVAALLELEPNLRLCKGIYREPPEVALQGFREIQRNYKSLARLLLQGGGYAAFATHDSELIRECTNLCRELRVGTHRFEFQALLGVREDQWDSLRNLGSGLRIYCPYGADWYEYSTRRLRENPRLLGHVLRGLLRSPRPR